jgi:hypothetical protein
LTMDIVARRLVQFGSVAPSGTIRLVVIRCE